MRHSLEYLLLDGAIILLGVLEMIFVVEIDVLS